MLAMIEIEISTVDPDHVDHGGCTALDHFISRQQMPQAELHPAQTIPTLEEEELFHQLLDQMRDRYIGLTGFASDEDEESEDGYDSDSDSDEQGAADVEQEQAEYRLVESGDDKDEEEEWVDAQEVVQGDVC
jgi:hypothetical protein